MLYKISIQTESINLGYPPPFSKNNAKLWHLTYSQIAHVRLQDVNDHFIWKASAVYKHLIDVCQMSVLHRPTF